MSFVRLIPGGARAAGAVSLFVVSVLSTLTAPTLASPLPPGAELPPLKLEELLAGLDAGSAELAARRLEAAAAQERPTQARALEDPSLSVELWQAPFDVSRVPVMFTLRQPLPGPGKLKARVAVAAPEVAAASAASQNSRRNLRLELTRAYFDYRLAVRTGAVLRQSQQLLGTIVSAVNIRYRVGKAELAELLRAQEAQSNQGNQLLDVERERDIAAATINVLLGRPPGDPLGPPVTAPTETSATSLPAPSQLTAWAIAHRPDGAALRAALAISQARGALARAERAPDLALWAGAMAMLRGGEHTFTVGMQASIPSFSLVRSGAAMREAQAQGAAQRELLRQLETRIAGEIHTTLLRLETARRHLRLHEQTTIPLAEQTAKAAQLGYQNGRTDLVLLLDAVRTLFDHQLEYERFDAEYGQRLGELEAVLGAPLAALASGGRS